MGERWGGGGGGAIGGTLRRWRQLSTDMCETTLARERSTGGAPGSTSVIAGCPRRRKSTARQRFSFTDLSLYNSASRWPCQATDANVMWVSSLRGAGVELGSEVSGLS